MPQRSWCYNEGRSVVKSCYKRGLLYLCVLLYIGGSVCRECCDIREDYCTFVCSGTKKEVFVMKSGVISEIYCSLACSGTKDEVL